jgi:hypothetical protein
MGAGGGQSGSSEPWSGIDGYLKYGYADINDVIRGQDTPRQYNELQPGFRQGVTNQLTGIDANNANRLRSMGLDAGATREAVRSGGFTPFTQLEQQAQQQAANIANRGPDRALFDAQNQLANNGGISMLSSANPALSHLQEGASGQFLSHETNPYLADAVKAAQDPVIEQFRAEVLPSVTGQFGSSGRFGSGAHQYAVKNATDDLTKNLADASTNAFFSNYSQERANQLASQQSLGQLSLSQGQALAEANQRNAAIMPSLSGAIRGQEMEGLRLLEGVGGAQGDKARELAGMAAEPYNFRTNDERNRIHEYMSLLNSTPQLGAGGGGGGGQSKTASALGGAATGASIGSVGGPWGAAAGGVIGGVGGYFL